MGLTMSRRRAVTVAITTRYRRAGKAEEGLILDELCATTGWHRSHARKALGQAGKPRVVRERRARPPKYGPEVMGGLRRCWAVLGAPTGKRLAPMMAELVPRLRRFGELDLDDQTAAALMAMSAATMDRRLAPDRAKLDPFGRSHTKPGSLLKDSIPIRTWAQWNDAQPGFVEIDLVGHEGGNAVGDHAYTLTVTDIATGWTENRPVRNKVTHPSTAMGLRSGSPSRRTSESPGPATASPLDWSPLCPRGTWGDSSEEVRVPHSAPAGLYRPRSFLATAGRHRLNDPSALPRLRVQAATCIPAELEENHGQEPERLPRHPGPR